MPTPLRIAHINTEKTWRGGEQQMFNLVTCLNERGHTNICFARTGGALAERLKIAKFPTYEFRPVFEWDVLAAKKLSRWIRAERIDLVHVHSSHAMVQAALARQFHDVPTIATRRVDFHINKNPFSRWKYAQMDRIIAISDAVRNILLADGIASAKLIVVKSGVDAKRLAQITPLSKTEMGFSEDHIVIGQVAALADHKDQSTLLQAVALLKESHPNLRFAFVGDGPLRAQIEDLAVELNVADRVNFFGFRADALRLLAGFDFFCLSSKTEGLGTSLIDAMLLKVPIVATRAGGIPELIEDGRTGLLAEPSDPARLAAALAQAVDPKFPRAQVVGNAFEKAQGFTAEHTADQMETVYRNVLQNRG